MTLKPIDRISRFVCVINYLQMYAIFPQYKMPAGVELFRAKG